MTSWMWASGGVFTASATTFATVSGRRNRSGVVFAALVGDQAFLHHRRDPPGMHRRHPKLPSSLRSESAKPRNANLLAEYDAKPGEALMPEPELMNTT